MHNFVWRVINIAIIIVDSRPFGSLYQVTGTCRRLLATPTLPLAFVIVVIVVVIAAIDGGDRASSMGETTSTCH